MVMLKKSLYCSSFGGLPCQLAWFSINDTPLPFVLLAIIAVALSAKLDNASYRVYTLLGDGEIQEGQVWEAPVGKCRIKSWRNMAF